MSKVTISTTFKGLLFEEGSRTRKLDNVIKKSLNYGVDIIKNRTPVITGYLKSAWQHDSESIYNFASYSLFVEEGTRYFEGRFMMQNSLPEIENLIDRLLIEALS